MSHQGRGTTSTPQLLALRWLGTAQVSALASSVTHLGGGTLTRLPTARSWGQCLAPGALDGLERWLVAPQAAQRGKHQFLSPGRNKAPGRAGKQPGTKGPGVLVDPELIEPAPCPCCKKADDLQRVPSQKPQLSACGSAHPAFLGALCQQRLLSALSSARWCCGPAVLAQGCFGELCLRVSSWWCVLFFFPWSRDIQSLERTAESRSACRCLLSPPKDRLKLVFSPD